MTTTTHADPHALHELQLYPGRPRLAVVRDVLLIALCVSLMIGFLAQVWRGPAPAAHRSTEQAMVAPDLVAPAPHG